MLSKAEDAYAEQNPDEMEKEMEEEMEEEDGQVNNFAASEC